MLEPGVKNPMLGLWSPVYGNKRQKQIKEKGKRRKIKLSNFAVNLWFKRREILIHSQLPLRLECDCLMINWIFMYSFCWLQCVVYLLLKFLCHREYLVQRGKQLSHYTFYCSCKELPKRRVNHEQPISIEILVLHKSGQFF